MPPIPINNQPKNSVKPVTTTASSAIPLAIVLKGYPRLSETFIAQEILNLERNGFMVLLISLRHPTDKKTHPIHDEIKAEVNYLPEYLYQQPLRIWRCWRIAKTLSGYKQAFKTFLKDLRRDRSANRIRRFGQALVLAAELPAQFTNLYAHFLHTPASVTRYAAIMRGIPWAVSAHAKDIYTSSQWEIREKLDDCQWLTTCTQANTAFLSPLTQDANKVFLNYHGLDLSRFSQGEPNFSHRDGARSDDPVVLLSVGRAVEKKGYDGLLHALSTIDPAIHWKFIHIGGGGLLKDLNTLAQQLDIAGNIEWLGAQSQETVLSHYQSADIFVLNSCIDQHGDRDGLPNVIVEAQSQGLPVVSTNISGIPELIQHQYNGLLVQSGDADALAENITMLIQSPKLRQQYGHAGKDRVFNEFDMITAFSALKQRLLSLTAN